MPDCPKEIAKPFCGCIDDFVHNSCGVCIPRNKCGQPGYDNCQYETPIVCPLQNEVLYGCHDPMQTKYCPGVQPPASACNTDGLTSMNICDCGKGFVKNFCDECILPKDCDKPCSIKYTDLCSDPNAIRVRCATEADILTCKEVLNKKSCARKLRKKNKCICRAGYAVDDCGHCRPIDECDIPCRCTCPCDKATEEWRCISTCIERSCAHSNILLKCAANCTYACDCKLGTYRLSKYETCVAKNKC